MTISFFGHRDVNFHKDLIQKLKIILENQIYNGADTFLLGGYGSFDLLCGRIIKEFKTKHPHIKSLLVIPYLNQRYNIDLYDEIVYPPIENTPLKFAIVKRNQWMILNSDVVIAYVEHSWGGAAKAISFAKQKKKDIINVFELK